LSNDTGAVLDTFRENVWGMAKYNRGGEINFGDHVQDDDAARAQGAGYRAPVGKFLDQQATQQLWRCHVGGRFPQFLNA
jgi:hypothetical protein